MWGGREDFERFDACMVDIFHQYYADGKVNMEERLKMHEEDYDVGTWPRGEPRHRKRKRKLFLENVTREHTCDSCRKSLPMTGFQKKLLANAKTRGRKLVCCLCQVNGYSPKDCSAYTCSHCGHEYGHLRFDRRHLDHWRRKLSSRLTCKGCSALCKPAKLIGSMKKHQCVVCKEKLAASSFDKHVLFHGIYHGRKLVCDGCHALGYSPKDCTPYFCLHVHYCGHRQFKPDELKVLKRRGALVSCIRCKDRKTKLLKILRSRGSWKCKCPKVKMWHERKHGIKFPDKHWFMQAWFRSKEGTHESPACPLIPQNVDEMRWKGKNRGITEDDMAFPAQAEAW